MLLRRKKRIESLVYGLNDGIILLDEYNNIVLVNSKAQKFFSIEHLQILNKNIFDLRLQSLKLDNFCKKIFSGKMENGQTEFYDVDSDQYFNIDKIEVMRRGKVRRARLFYLRTKIGKAARIKERRV